MQSYDKEGSAVLLPCFALQVGPAACHIKTARSIQHIKAKGAALSANAATMLIFIVHSPLNASKHNYTRMYWLEKNIIKQKLNPQSACKQIGTHTQKKMSISAAADYETKGYHHKCLWHCLFRTLICHSFCQRLTA